MLQKIYFKVYSIIFEIKKSYTILYNKSEIFLSEFINSRVYACEFMYDEYIIKNILTFRQSRKKFNV